MSSQSIVLQPRSTGALLRAVLGVERYAVRFVGLTIVALLLLGCDASDQAHSAQNPTAQGNLMSNVAVQRDQLAARQEALSRLSEDLSVVRAALGELRPQDMDFDKLADGANKAAEPAADPPAELADPAIEDILSHFEREYDRIDSVLAKFAPTYSADSKAPSAADFPEPDLYARLSGILSRTIPRSVNRCRGYNGAPDAPGSGGAPVARRVRALACAQVVSELADGWLTGATAQLGRELDNQIARTRRSVDANAAELKEKEEALKSLQESLRASTSLDTLVKYGFLFMIGVVVIMFLAMRVFDGNTQSQIISTRLLLDIVIVLVLVTAILILGLSKSLSAEVLGTLMSGIIGYTLGRTSRGVATRPSTPEQKAAKQRTAEQDAAERKAAEQGAP